MSLTKYLERAKPPQACYPPRAGEWSSEVFGAGRQRRNTCLSSPPRYHSLPRPLNSGTRRTLGENMDTLTSVLLTVLVTTKTLSQLLCSCQSGLCSNYISPDAKEA